MILGIDLHGVIDDNPEKFKELMESVEKYNSVYVISGPPTFQIRAELQKLGITQIVPHYNRIFSVVDYLQVKKAKMWQDERGRWWASEEDWWSTKARICDEYHVDFMIDDKEAYEPYFRTIDTRFMLYKKGEMTIYENKSGN